MTPVYWGPFLEMRGDASLSIEELEPFSGLMAELYDQLSPTDWDESEYLRLASATAGPVLELGCGTGRILLRLASAGHATVGLDRSEPMLGILQQRLLAATEDVRNRVQLVCADATDFHLEARFGLVLLPYFTLGLFSGRSDQGKVIRCAAEHLADEGLFVFDFLTVLDESAPALAGEVIERDFSLGGRPLQAQFGVKYFDSERALVVNSCFRAEDEGTRPRRYLLSFREEVFAAAEIAAMVEDAGLVIASRQTEDFPDGATRRTVMACRRRSRRPRPLWHPYHPMSDTAIPPITLVEGSGCEVVDDLGRRYLDASGGLWSVQCGLGRGEIVDAVSRQLQRLSYGTLFLGRASETALELSRRLVAMAMSPLEWVYLTGSGSESVELAIKLARSFFSLQGRPEKRGVLYLDASYHGTFFGSIGVSGLVPEKEVFAPLLPGLGAVPTPLPESCPAGTTFEEFALGFAAMFETMLDHAGREVAAFILEPVLGSAGVVILPAAYLDRILRACRKHDVLLIVDEIATGFGRTGRWFASEHSGLRPDLMLLGKGINSGYLPLGAVLFSAEIGERLIAAGTGIVHGSSHNGNPACCAAALATFDVLWRDRLVERSRQLGEYFLSGLQARAGTPGLGAARGLGLMLFSGLRDESGAAATQAQVLAVCTAMQARGVLAYPAPGGLMFLPALTISQPQIDTVLGCLEAVLRAHRLVGGGLEAARP